LLEDKILSKKACIGVIGIGYVGLPLSITISNAGFQVMGFDIDHVKTEMLNKGESYIEYIPDDTIKNRLDTGLFSATNDFDLLREMDVIVICVPTPLDSNNEPELKYVVDTAVSIRDRLRKDQLVILESTTYPGTTDEVVKSILDETGLVCGDDYYLAYSPEREDPANKDYSTYSIPKIVAGVNEKSGKLAKQFYSIILDKIVPLENAREAEAAKILENVYRAINIALVNELKIIFDKMGIDIWKVISAAKTKPFGFQAFYPGPGLGGHCVPIDPFYLAWKAKQYGVPTRFIELAGEINHSMPDYIIDKTSENLSKNGKQINGAKILVIGVAYKKDVGDIRESPALVIIDKLIKKEAEVFYHDPYIVEVKPTRRFPQMKMKSSELNDRFLESMDAVIIVTDHTNLNYKQIVEKSRLIVDTRNAFSAFKDYEYKIVKA